MALSIPKHLTRSLAPSNCEYFYGLRKGFISFSSITLVGMRQSGSFALFFSNSSIFSSIIKAALEVVAWELTTALANRRSSCLAMWPGKMNV